MPPHESSHSGPFAVGLLALHDRRFFERLLAEPRRTLSDSALVGDLNLTPADVDEVVRMIERATHDFSPAIALRAWDSYAANGHWGSNGWPTHWPPFIRGNRPQGPSRPGNRPE